MPSVRPDGPSLHVHRHVLGLVAGLWLETRLCKELSEGKLFEDGGKGTQSVFFLPQYQSLSMIDIEAQMRIYEYSGAFPLSNPIRGMRGVHPPTTRRTNFCPAR